MRSESNKVIEYNKSNLENFKNNRMSQEKDNINLDLEIKENFEKKESLEKDLEIKENFEEKENLQKDLEIKKYYEEEKRDEIKKEEKKQSDSTLLNIKSKYIFDKINDYLEDKILMLKLIKHSKKLQNKLNYEMIVYQYCYFLKIEMYPDNYFYSHKKYGDNLKLGLEEDLKNNKIDAKDYENFILNYWKILELEKNIMKLGCGYFIVIDSPFINIVSKTKHFDKYMLMIRITDDNLNNNLMNFFNNLNQMNLIYPEISIEFSSNNTNNLKLYNINFDKIKVLKIINNTPCDIFKDIFSFFNIYNNIIYMELHCSKDYKINTFEILNNFKSLKFLSLYNFKFENPYILKLYNLIELKIFICENIGFEENKIFNIETLEITYSKIIKPKSYIKFPKLENYDINNKEIINYLLDPLFINKVKVIKCSSENFLEIENIFLEELTLENPKDELDLQIFEKILKYKNLKSVTFTTNLSDEQISKIDGKNNSITTLYLTNYEAKGDMINLINKFPNLKLFSLTSEGIENKDIELLENPNCKINSIKLTNLSNVKVYCQSYDSLITLYLDLMKISNYNNIFPFNIINKKISFKSLTDFTLDFKSDNNIDIGFLNKLDNILDYMPNLIHLSLIISSPCITEYYCMKLLKNILLKKNKLNDLYYSVLSKYSNPSISLNFTRNEIENMFPDIKFGNIYSIVVKKFI